MAVAMKGKRCAACGSSDVTEVRGIYRCCTCGSDRGLMCESDLARINRVVLYGGSEADITRLRERYPNLGITVQCGGAPLILN